VQAEGGAHRLRQGRHRRLDPAQGIPRGRRRLRRAGDAVGRVRRKIERAEQPPLEAPPPRPVEGEVADHSPDIGVRLARDALRRLGDEPQHHVLHDVLGQRGAIQDAPRPVQMGGAAPRERRPPIAARQGSGGHEVSHKIDPVQGAYTSKT